MKKSVCLFAMLVIFAACNSGNKKSENNQHQSANISIVEDIEKKDAGIDYTQYPLAYLIEGVLYFHNFENNEKVKFVEEPEAIFNFTFDTEGKTLYYNVERDSSLWLKSADISESQVTPRWVADWKLKKDDCITDTYGEISPLLYHKGELLMEHGFIWDYYDFRKFDIYSIAGKEKKSLEKESGGRFLEKFIVELPDNKADQYFKTTKQQLYYTRNNAKVCLTDKLDFEALKGEGEGWVKTEFYFFTFSPDETKILFGALMAFGDLPHGPYCIANADGSRQLIIEESSIAYKRNPAWLKNNTVAFTDTETNLFVTNNDDNSVQKIAENVSVYVAR